MELLTRRRHHHRIHLIDFLVAQQRTIVTERRYRGYLQIRSGDCRLGLLVFRGRGGGQFVHRKLDTSGILALCDYRPQFGVLRLFMSAQVHFPLEGSTAEVAGERFEPGMLSGMRYQVRGLTEGFPAYGTFVWLLSCKIKKKT